MMLCYDFVVFISYFEMSTALIHRQAMFRTTKVDFGVCDHENYNDSCKKRQLARPTFISLSSRSPSLSPPSDCSF